MNLRPEDIRSASTLRMQRDLEQMLAARRARDAAREERFRKLPTPRSQYRAEAKAASVVVQFPSPASASATPPKRITRRQLVVAGTLYLAALAGALWLAAHDPSTLSRAVECAIGGAA